MNISKKQKKYIKKHLKIRSLPDIAKSLGLPPEELEKYLGRKSEKTKKNFASVQNDNDKISSFNLKRFLLQNWKQILFLIILIAAAYFNSLNNQFVSDDLDGILRNKRIDQFSNVTRGPFNIFQNFIFFLVTKAFGKVPIYYRLTVIFFHILTTLVLFALISILANPAAAFFTAAIFAVHPLLIESVAWISSGYMVYGAFFALLTFLFYLKSKNKNLKSLYLISYILYLLTLESSQKYICFPAALFLYEFLFGSLKKNWKKLIVFFLLSGFWAINLIHPLEQRADILKKNYYQDVDKKNNPVLQVPVAVSSYLEMAVWPKKLTLYHSEMSFTRGEYILRFAVFLFFVAVILTCLKYKKEVAFWLVFFIIGLGPTLTPFALSWIVAERYVYLGSIGLFAIAGLIFEKLYRAKNLKIPTLIIFFIILSALFARTVFRNKDWKNEDNLWLATAKYSPSSPLNHNNLGDYYTRHNDLEKAAEEFKNAIKLKSNFADAYHNLANTYYKMGKIDTAVEYYQKAIAINPNLWQSYQTLSAIYFQQKDYEKAKTLLLKAIEINPNDTYLHSNLAILYLKASDKEAAKKELQISLQIDPGNDKARKTLQEIL